MQTAVGLIGMCTFGYVAHDGRPGADLPARAGGTADHRHRRRGARNPRRRAAALHHPGARLQRARGRRRSDRRAGNGWSTPPTSSRCCCCWKPTTTSPSRLRSAVNESDAINILLVPPAEPRTKPKACNYGLHFATGDIVTIYDAEDMPEPLQLRRVVAAFGRAAGRRRMRAGETGLSQRRAESADRMVHRRIRSVVRLPAYRE